MTYLDRARDLYAKMGAGQTMEAFETYYHDDVIVKEPTGETRRGKAAQRQAMQEWMASVDTMHGGATEWITANEDDAVTMVQSMTDVTIDGQRRSFREIAVQQWDGDQITQEAFFYYVPAEEQRPMKPAR